NLAEHQVTFLAHAFGQRYELPIPLVLFVIGGAAVVLVSFLLVFRSPVEPGVPADRPDRIHLRAMSPVWAPISIVLLALLIVAGLTGSQEIPENIVPTAYWVVIWVAVPLSCGLIGDWTQPVNPYANLAKLADSPRLRSLLLGDAAPVGWPRRLGWWPAAVL